MREILFRGKRLDNEQWVEGFYVRLYDYKGHESHRIYPGYAETDCEDYFPYWFEVDPSTVGECTGLKDKNGKLIFEGDIVEHHAQGDIIVNRGVINWDERNARWAHQLNTMNPCLYLFNSEAWEVIGNIHDNPELMEG